MIADGSYDLNKEDPLIRLLGPEHGGRSRTTMTACELLIKVADSQVKVASGTAWPTSGAIIHGKSLEEGCVKVQVDKIIESYGDLPVHAVTKTDEVETVKDIYHAVVQWPIYALKLANKETPSKSTRMDSSHSSPQRDTTTNKETPSKSTRMDSSHSSPQKDIATTSFYYPPFVDNQIPIHPFDPFDGSYTNMLLSLTPRQIATNPTEPKFIDPDVEASLSILRKKGPKYNKILDLLSGLYGDDFSILTYSPQGLYPDRVQFAVPYSEILQPLLNDLLDVSIIRWFAMYFYGLPNNSNCVFFDPEVIKDSNVQTNPVGVIKHMKEIFLHHKEKTYFLAPYIKG
ncbi:hypothetical protein LXL04_027384 [Taraxacum kok-saghyz]